MVPKKFLSKFSIHFFLVFYTIICALTIQYFNGTGDSGDSIHHYLFARYAPSHPNLFFNHWAKPVFVLLASPFAQFGFKGMKIFNCLVSLFTILLTYKAALKLNYQNAILVAVIILFSPLFYILTFSGLTEPLFALFSIWGFYLCTQQKNISAAAVISFLPYIRSEGLILVGVFGLYFLIHKQWKTIPFLLLGSIVYGIAGYFVYKDVLWVFTKIPYSTLSSVYGSGHLFHFVEQLINVSGVPLFALFWLGFLYILILTFRKKTNTIELLLLLGGFLTFFLAHSLFWYLGIFNSMGLKRVLIGIIPLIALITLKGFNLATEFPSLQNASWPFILKFIFLLYIVVFPFTSNPSAIQWKKDMTLSPDQELAIKSLEFFKPTLHQRPPMFNYYYLSVVADLDYFDPEKCLRISEENIQAMKTGDVLIWDDKYAVEETGLTKEQLDGDSSLVNQFTYKTTEYNHDYVFAGYIKK